MQDKSVGIYINVYNTEKYIAETVDAILSQTYKNLKLVVVDDASTDNTLEVLKEFDDPRLTIIPLAENGHISNCLNTGLAAVEGDYIAHCDSDDVWEKDKLEKQIEFLESQKEYGACFTYVDMIDKDGNDANEEYSGMLTVFNIENRSQSEMLRLFCDHSNHFHHSSFVARSEVVKKVGLYDFSMPTLHDYDYWLRLLCVAPVYIIEKPLVKIRMHTANNSSMNEGKWNSHDTEYLRAIEKCIAICPDDVFLKAFADKLLLEGEHTAQEVEIEKAFVLGEIFTPIYYNPLLSVEKLAKLLNIKEYRDILSGKFNFTQKDLNELERYKLHYNPKDKEVFETELKALRTEIADINMALANAQYNYDAISNSRWWMLTAPARAVCTALKSLLNKTIFLKKIITGFLCLFTKAGRHKLKRKLNSGKTSASQWKISASKRSNQENFAFGRDVKFSILVPLYNTPKNFLTEMIASVCDQTYKNWELCLADGSTADFAFVGDYCKSLAQNDPRIKYKRLENNGGISENTNACIEMSTGDYIALFDHDDLLHPSALFEYAKVINEQNADFIYCDEDKFTKTGGRLYDAFFKPDFSPDMLRSVNYICHFTVFARSLMEKAGTFRKEFDGSQDHDIILRLTEKAENIVHVPKILYHWRISSASVASDPYAKPYTIDAGKKAVAEHLERVGLKGTVESTDLHPNYYRVKYELTSKPLISIIIPNYNQVPALSRCIESIVKKSTYDNYEIIIVENNSNAETFAYYDTLKKYPQIKVVVFHPKDGFNYSEINNYGMQFASGEHILLLNNDVEIISENWMEEMLMFSQREDIGAVGALLYYPNDTVQHAGVVLGIGGVAGHAFKYYPAASGGYFGRLAYQQNYSAVTAACLMMKRSIYDEIGGLDETFKVAFNDVDLCMKIRQAGYLIAYTPFAKLYHHESISRGAEDTPEKQARFSSEVKRFLDRWGDVLQKGDPYYNPNLTLESEDFSFKD